MKQQIETDVIKIFADYCLGYNVNIFCKFDDLDIDTLDCTELVMALEEKFDIEIDDEDADNFTSIYDVVVYIQSILIGAEDQIQIKEEVELSSIELTETLESKISFISADKVIELIQNYFVNKENVEIYNILVTMHRYTDANRDYSFYIEVNKEFVSEDETLQYVESYRFKQKEILELINVYLKQFNIVIDKTPNGDCLWIKYEQAYEFHFRFVDIN